jgi:hypothetical protein
LTNYTVFSSFCPLIAAVHASDSPHSSATKFSAANVLRPASGRAFCFHAIIQSQRPFFGAGKTLFGCPEGFYVSHAAIIKDFSTE